MPQTPAELRERVDRAEPLLRAVGNVYHVADLLVSAVYRALCHGSDRDAIDFVSRATPLTRELDSPYLWMMLRGNFAMAALLTGDIDAARRGVPRGARTVPRAGRPPLRVRRPDRPGRSRHRPRRTAPGRTTRSAPQLRIATAAEDPVDARLRMSFFEPARTGCPERHVGCRRPRRAALSFDDAIAYALEEPRR